MAVHERGTLLEILVARPQITLPIVRTVAGVILIRVEGEHRRLLSYLINIELGNVHARLLGIRFRHN